MADLRDAGNQQARAQLARVACHCGCVGGHRGARRRDRLYLGAHYLSDALATMPESLAWVVLCYASVETLRRT